MFDWLVMIAPVYLTYYTFIYAVTVWRKERNMLACVFISILALSLTAIPIWLKIR
ncbi:hypothetical protein [Pseudobacteroides cellulosolvens]|uniref:Uncharacterized protein n=1 Tax=Pseudobacteroides cellulosolvens ATCC 35603 = DSM 2933 TaxID=398512 RepID=A0A0L6JT30_9FIRM|nr:hypothetical protein [Pseudobacteroides cellulosolvens]KNY28973.1 hypothetical protein Bccel_4247 [Pseudobacteroides cellulosolvens ATCC 35603 = DSM 2933]